MHSSPQQPTLGENNIKVSQYVIKNTVNIQLLFLVLVIINCNSRIRKFNYTQLKRDFISHINKKVINFNK